VATSATSRCVAGIFRKLLPGQRFRADVPGRCAGFAPRTDVAHAPHRCLSGL
jgi:hypothetical protein